MKGVPYLRPLSSYIDVHLTQKKITMQAKLLSPYDCQSLLGSGARRLFKKHRRRQPLYPIQISVTNQSDKLIALNPANIDLPLVDYHTVIQRLYRNTFMNTVGSIIASLAITSLLAIGSVFALGTSGILLIVIGNMGAFAPFAFIGSSALLITPFFLVIGTPVISTMQGIKTAQYNHQTKHEIKKHTLNDILVIQPFETIDTLIFVEKNKLKKEFTIKINDPENACEYISFPIVIQNHHVSGWPSTIPHPFHT